MNQVVKTLILIIVLALIGWAVWFFVPQDAGAPTDGLKNLDSFEKGFVYVEHSRVRGVYFFDFDSGSSYKLTVLPQQNHAFINEVQLVGDKLYFIDIGALWLSAYDLSSGSLTRIDFPEISGERNLTNSFLVNGDNIFHTRGGCGEGFDCQVYLFNVISGEDVPIGEKLETDVLSGINIFDYHPSRNTLVLSLGGGDGGFIFRELLETTVSSDNFTRISQGQCEVEDCVLNNEEVSFERFLEELYTKKHDCSGVFVKETLRKVSFQYNNEDKELDDVLFGGCHIKNK